MGTRDVSRLVFVAAVLLTWPINVEAIEYTFTLIADTSGTFSSFSDDPHSTLPASPSMNNNGTVAFKAGLDAGGEGVFVGDGTTVATIADTNDPSTSFTSFSLPSINDDNIVAFSANIPASADHGIFTSDGTVITTVAETGFFQTPRPPAINNNGTIAFSVFFADGRRGIFIASEGNITATPQNFLITNPEINDNDTIVYGSAFTVSIIHGDTLTTIVDTSGIFSNLSPVSINNNETVAFKANLDAGGSGIFLANGTTITTVADTGAGFFAVSINNIGTVAFLAAFGTVSRGIFTGPNFLDDKVIQTGEPLFGSTVTNLSCCEDINDSGQIPFFAELADGREVIVRADPANPTFEAIVSNSVKEFFDEEWDRFRDEIYNLLSLYPDDTPEDPECFLNGEFLNGEPFSCQTIVAAQFQEGAGASFVPHFDLTLSQAAAAGGYDHFNWVQFLDRTWDQNTATGADFDCNQAKVVRGTEDCEIDPPFGGSINIAELYGEPLPVRDRFPPYLDEQYTVDARQIYDKNGNLLVAGDCDTNSEHCTRLEAWTLTDQNTLLFSDAPGGNVRFKTCLVGGANAQNGVATATLEIIDLPGTCFWWYVTTNPTRSIRFGRFIDPGTFSHGELKLFRRFCIGIRGLDLPRCVKAMPWLSILLLDD